MASAEQLNAYHSECSDISFGDFDLRRSIEYDPSSEDYYEDVIRDNGEAGAALGFICLFVFLVLSVCGLVLCCIPHHWIEHKDFLGNTRKSRYLWQRILSLLFVLGILCCTILVTAMSIWGIVRVVTDVQDVVPESFDFLEETKQQLDSIHSNLTAAVTNGNNIVTAVRVAVEEVKRDSAAELLSTIDPELDQTFFEVVETFEEATNDAEDALDTVDSEINENLDEILDGMRDAIGYRDEGEGINDAGRIVVIAAFSLFIVFSVGSTLFSLCGASPRCTLFWAMTMWFMLTIAFWLVGIVHIGREISRETCLYIDTYAVEELKDEVSRDTIRTEQLLWHYFRAPSTAFLYPAQCEKSLLDDRNKNLTELEDLWGFPLTDVMEFLDTAEEEIFDGDVLAFPYNLAENSTQDAVLAVRVLIPQARRDIDYVQNLIQGETLHTIHSDFKDLICCTEYDSVDAVWTAWVVSSAFGLLIAILMTLQGLMSLRFGRSGPLPLASARAPTQKTSAYMAPPVAEGGYSAGDGDVTARNESGMPLRSNDTTSSSTVKYPTLNPPTVYF